MYWLFKTMVLVPWSTLPFELHSTIPFQPCISATSASKLLYSFMHRFRLWCSQPNCRVTRSIPPPQWGQAQRSKKGPEKSREGASKTAELQAKVRQVEVLDAAKEHPGQIRGEDKRRRIAAGRHGSALPLSSGNAGPHFLLPDYDVLRNWVKKIQC